MQEKPRFYRQETTGIRYPIGDLFGYPDSLIRGRTGAAYQYGLQLIGEHPRAVLDFGSGRGHGVQAIKDILNPKIIVSADKYIPYLHAQRLALVDGQPTPTPYHFVGAKDQLPFADGAFDVVTMMHVIEHVKDPAGVLKDLSRVLSPNGKLLIATPDIRNLVGNSPYDEHVFGRDELAKAFEENGFTADFHYIVPNERARRVHERKKWLGTHAPWTQHIRNHTNPQLYEAVVFRSGISREPLTEEDFTLTPEYDPATIDLVVLASKA